MVIDVDVATLLQTQLGETLGIGENATIFEICAAIDAEGLDIAAVINALELDLDPIVTAQISQIVNQIAIAINEITGIPITPELIDEILASINIDAIVAQITANVQVSIGILSACLGLLPPCEITVDTITGLGDSPRGIAHGPGTPYMYVTNFNNDTVSVIDTNTNSVIATLPVEDGPIGIAYAPGTQHMWVTNLNDDSISLINTNTNTVDGGASGAEDGPLGIASGPNTQFMYVTNFNNDTVSVIDIITQGVVDNIPVGDAPFSIAHAPGTPYMYVTNFSNVILSLSLILIQIQL